MNIAVFQFERTVPSWVQPDVPDVIPNVFVPYKPLLVAAKI
jgi:hypothetical protein